MTPSQQCLEISKIEIGNPRKKVSFDRWKAFAQWHGARRRVWSRDSGIEKLAERISSRAERRERRRGETVAGESFFACRPGLTLEAFVGAKCFFYRRHVRG